MEQQLDQIELLLSIFDQREKLKHECDLNIARLLTPTVLGALVELFELPDENVRWEEFTIVDTVLVIRTTLVYNPSGELSAFMAAIAAIDSDYENLPIEVHKQVQFAIPLTKAFESKQTLKEWFSNTLQQPKTQSEQLATPPPEIKLSKEQLAQVLYFQTLYGDPQ